jgi:hypothetical protein
MSNLFKDEETLKREKEEREKMVAAQMQASMMLMAQQQGKPPAREAYEHPSLRLHEPCFSLTACVCFVQENRAWYPIYTQ